MALNEDSERGSARLLAFEVEPPHTSDSRRRASGARLSVSFADDLPQAGDTKRQTSGGTSRRASGGSNFSRTSVGSRRSSGLNPIPDAESDAPYSEQAVVGSFGAKKTHFEVC